MIRSKKGAGFLEVNYLFTGIFFFFLFGIGLNLILSDADIEEKSFNQTLDEMTEEMGVISGTIVSLLLGVGSFIFGLFNVSLLNSVSVLPLWFNGFLALYSIFIIVFLIAWFVVWIGNLIPFT